VYLVFAQAHGAHTVPSRPKVVVSEMRYEIKS
jgi:hypothetical protein